MMQSKMAKKKKGKKGINRRKKTSKEDRKTNQSLWNVPFPPLITSFPEIVLVAFSILLFW